MMALVGRIFRQTSTHFTTASNSMMMLQRIRCMSSSKLFVGAKIVVDRVTGRSRGFAFVTFTSNEEACYVKAMDGQYLHGRRLRVNYATEKGSGFGGGGGYKDCHPSFYDDPLPCGCLEGFSVWCQ